jgi:hypothetical protein
MEEGGGKWKDVCVLCVCAFCLWLVCWPSTRYFACAVLCTVLTMAGRSVSLSIQVPGGPSLHAHLPARAPVAFSRLAQVSQLSFVASIPIGEVTKLTNTRIHLMVRPTTSCDWFSADALYTILPNTTDLGALTFPMGRTYVALGVNQPRLGKAMYR